MRSSKMRKGIQILVCVVLLIGLLIPGAQVTHAASTHSVTSYDELLAAINTAAAGDTISITRNIGILGTVNIDKNLTIAGNGHLIAVPVQGLDHLGVLNTSPSAFAVFNIGNTATVTMKNLRIRGGDAQGAGVYNAGTLLLEGVQIFHCANGGSGGGAIYNSGNLTLSSCNISRNASDYGGGFYNDTTGVLMIDNSSFCENRSLLSQGGGGAGENRGTLYINNSTFSNNKSTELGGAINNSGMIVAQNATFTGNVTFNASYRGGAIANNNGDIELINCLFAYNYCLNGAQDYILNDVDIYAGMQASATNCLFHADMTASILDPTRNTAYTGAVDGSDNSLFSGGALTKVLDASGSPVAGDKKVFQPFVSNTAGGLPVNYLKPGNTLTGTGIQTACSPNIADPVFGYNDGTNWISIVGANPENYPVLKDQSGITRANPGSIGSMEATKDNEYMVKIIAPVNGTIDGATIYGDLHKSGTTVVLVATPITGYHFAGWTNEESTIVSQDYRYKFKVQSNVTLTATFLPNTTTEFVITYHANNSLATGLPPVTKTYSGTAAIAGFGTLEVTGSRFTHWNTSPGGSGTSYAVGETYSGPGNLDLYAQWNSGTLVTFDTNGGSAIAPVYVPATDPVPVPTNPTKTDADFVGWYTDKALTAAYTFGQPVGAADITLYAKWMTREVTVSFNTDGGGALNPVTRRYQSLYGLDAAGNASSLPVPTKAGHVFAGWHYYDGGLGTLITDNTTVFLNVNHTLTAIWNAQVEVAFDLQGDQGTLSPEIKVVNLKYGVGADGSTSVPLPTPTREHYDFKGWYSSATGGNLVTNDTVVINSAKHTLYASWAIRLCTVTFSSMGGTSVAPATVNSGTAITKPTDPTWVGHTFQGWYTASSGGSAYNFSALVTSNFTLYARWTNNSGPVPTPTPTPEPVADPLVTRVVNQIESLTTNNNQPMTYDRALQILNAGKNYDALNEAQKAEITSAQKTSLSALQTQAEGYLNDHLKNIADPIDKEMSIDEYKEYTQLLNLNAAMGPTAAEQLPQESKDTVARIQKILGEKAIIEKPDVPTGYAIQNLESIAEKLVAADPEIGRVYLKLVVKEHAVDAKEIAAAIETLTKGRETPVRAFTAYISCIVYKTDATEITKEIPLSELGEPAILQFPFEPPPVEEGEKTPEYHLSGVSAALLTTSYEHTEIIESGKAHWVFETELLGEAYPVYAITQTAARDLTWLMYAGGGAAVLVLGLIIMGAIRKKKADR